MQINIKINRKKQLLLEENIHSKSICDSFFQIYHVNEVWCFNSVHAMKKKFPNFNSVKLAKQKTGNAAIVAMFTASNKSANFQPLIAIVIVRLKRCTSNDYNNFLLFITSKVENSRQKSTPCKLHAKIHMKYEVRISVKVNISPWVGISGFWSIFHDLPYTWILCYFFVLFVRFFVLFLHY